MMIHYAMILLDAESSPNTYPHIFPFHTYERDFCPATLAVSSCNFLIDSGLALASPRSALTCPSLAPIRNLNAPKTKAR